MNVADKERAKIAKICELFGLGEEKVAQLTIELLPNSPIIAKASIYVDGETLDEVIKILGEPQE